MSTAKLSPRKYLIHYYSLGSDGDAVVAASLAYRLQELGHKVVIFCDGSTRGVFTGAHLNNIVDFPIDFQKQLEATPELQSSKNPLKTLASIPKLLVTLIDPLMLTVWREVERKRPDVAITNLGSKLLLQPLLHRMKQDGIPVMQHDTYLWTDTRTAALGIPPLLFGASLGNVLPQWSYWLQHRAVDVLLWQILGWLVAFRSWRVTGHTSLAGNHSNKNTDLLRIVGSPRVLLPEAAQKANIKNLQFVDPLLAPYWGTDNQELNSELSAFLEQYPNTPIWSAGMGSMPEKKDGGKELTATGLTELLVKVFQELEMPLVILTGKGGLGKEMAAGKEGVYCTDKANHDLLFARVTGHIFHGGLGTLYRLLIRGNPGIIFPHIVDQRYYAALTEKKLGTMRTLDLDKVTQASLRQAVLDMSRPEIALKAKAASKLVHDSGPETALLVERYLNDYYQAG